VRLARPPERDRLAERREQLLVAAGDLPKQPRVRRSGTDDVDVDAVARDFARERLDEADDAGLRRRVHGFAARADAPRVGTDADDLAGLALDHRIEDGARAADRALQIDRQHAVPGLLLTLHERLDLVPAGVVDEHVDRADALDRFGERVADRARIG